MKNLMNEVIEDSKRYPHHLPNATIDFVGDPMVNPDALKAILLNPEDTSDQQLQEIFAKKYSEILKETAMNGLYWNIFTHPRTVQLFAAILSNRPYGYEERLWVNMICTQFKYKCPKEYYEEVSSVIINNLGGMVNIKDIREVAAAVPELGYERATMIGILRCHSNSEYENYKAINDYLCLLSPELITPLVVVKIYESLNNYSQIKTSSLLSAIMFNPKTNANGYKKIHIMIDNNILSGVLCILNEIPLHITESAIRQYYSNLYGNHARGYLEVIAQNFPRVMQAIHNVHYQASQI